MPFNDDKKFTIILPALDLQGQAIKIQNVITYLGCKWSPTSSLPQSSRLDNTPAHDEIPPRRSDRSRSGTHTTTTWTT
ncbi:unnamed protein product, partial [Iphiclides podalirius]